MWTTFGSRRLDQWPPCKNRPVSERRTHWVALLLLAIGCGSGEHLSTVPGPQRGDRVLIIAPHIDDEAIGAAAYAADAVRVGAIVSVAYLTAGDDNFLSTAIEDRTFLPRPRDYLREGTDRIAEGRRAMALLGVKDLFFLGYPDRGLRKMIEDPDAVIEAPGTRVRQVPYAEALSPGADYTLRNLIRDLRAVAERTRPNVIITTAEFDAHPDHVAAGELGKLLSEELAPSPQLLYFLVHAAEFPEPYMRARNAALLPPRQFRRHRWAMYPVTRRNEKLKAEVLASYTSQWNDPWVRLLMDAFIRRNELFVQVK